MKIALINGSPKFKESASGLILEDLKDFLKGNELINFTFNKSTIENEVLEALERVNIFVIAFPLYVDGVPGHLLSCLSQIEDYFKDKDKNITVYPIANCGFYEAHQNKYALDIIKNWCNHCGFTYGQGFGIGAGGMLTSIKNVPIGKGPKKSLGANYEKFSKNIINCISNNNLFVSPNFPRFLYKFSAEMNWRRFSKANGLKSRDIFTKIG